MSANNMYSFNTFGHKDYQEENYVKNAQSKLKGMPKSKLPKDMLQALLRS